MNEVYVISAVRTPVGIGKPTGELNPLSPVDMTALVMQEAVRRAGVDPGVLEDAVWGCVTPIGDQGANLARLQCLEGWLPC